MGGQTDSTIVADTKVVVASEDFSFDLDGLFLNTVNQLSLRATGRKIFKNDSGYQLSAQSIQTIIADKQSVDGFSNPFLEAKNTSENAQKVFKILERARNAEERVKAQAEAKRLINSNGYLYNLFNFL